MGLFSKDEDDFAMGHAIAGIQARDTKIRALENQIAELRKAAAAALYELEEIRDDEWTVRRIESVRAAIWGLELAGVKASRGPQGEAPAVTMGLVCLGSTSVEYLSPEAARYECTNAYDRWFRLTSLVLPASMVAGAVRVVSLMIDGRELVGYELGVELSYLLGWFKDPTRRLIEVDRSISLTLRGPRERLPSTLAFFGLLTDRPRAEIGAPDAGATASAAPGAEVPLDGPKVSTILAINSSLSKRSAHYMVSAGTTAFRIRSLVLTPEATAEPMRVLSFIVDGVDFARHSDPGAWWLCDLAEWLSSPHRPQLLVYGSVILTISAGREKPNEWPSIGFLVEKVDEAGSPGGRQGDGDDREAASYATPRDVWPSVGFTAMEYYTGNIASRIADNWRRAAGVGPGRQSGADGSRGQHERFNPDRLRDAMGIDQPAGTGPVYLGAAAEVDNDRCVFSFRKSESDVLTVDKLILPHRREPIEVEAPIEVIADGVELPPDLLVVRDAFDDDDRDPPAIRIAFQRSVRVTFRSWPGRLWPDFVALLCSRSSGAVGAPACVAPATALDGAGDVSAVGTGALEARAAQAAASAVARDADRATTTTGRVRTEVEEALWIALRGLGVTVAWPEPSTGDGALAFHAVPAHVVTALRVAVTDQRATHGVHCACEACVEERRDRVAEACIRFVLSAIYVPPLTAADVQGVHARAEQAEKNLATAVAQHARFVEHEHEPLIDALNIASGFWSRPIDKLRYLIDRARLSDELTRQMRAISAQIEGARELLAETLKDLPVGVAVEDGEGAATPGCRK